jgi:hypothetical protein
VTLDVEPDAGTLNRRNSSKMMVTSLESTYLTDPVDFSGHPLPVSVKDLTITVCVVDGVLLLGVSCVWRRSGARFVVTTGVVREREERERRARRESFILVSVFGKRLFVLEVVMDLRNWFFVLTFFFDFSQDYLAMKGHELRRKTISEVEDDLCR